MVHFTYQAYQELPEGAVGERQAARLRAVRERAAGELEVVPFVACPSCGEEFPQGDPHGCPVR